MTTILNKYLDDSQSFIISINCDTFNTGGVASRVTLPMNLRFAADVMILKSIAYNCKQATADINDMIQIWCNLTNDNLITSFPNTGSNVIPVSTYLNTHFRLSNSFQTGNVVFELQCTDTAGIGSYGPQTLISTQNPQRSFGVVTLSLEFIKLKRK